MSNENALQALNKTSVSVFGSMDLFEQAQRMVMPLQKSTMVPEAYRNNIPNCMVAMEMSHRIGISVLEVMQNMQIVKGSVGWKSEYVINKVNSSGLFTDSLEFVFSTDRQSCYAIATKKSNGKELRGTLVSMELAKAEGWLTKNGSKWVTMPEQMLMYRAATFFCRVFCPEVLAGVQTSDEIIDIGYEPTTNLDKINNLNSKINPENASQGDNYAEYEEVDPEAVNDIETNFENVSQTEDSNFEPVTEKIEEDDDF